VAFGVFCKIGMHGVGNGGEHEGRGLGPMAMASLFWRFMYGIGINGDEVMKLVCRNTPSLEIYVCSQAFASSV
jgi:hypothetical protein